MSLFSQRPEQLSLGNGVTLAYHRSPGKAPGVIILGGFTSDMSGIKATTLEQWCRGRGQAFIRFDYSGHGASPGQFADGTIGGWAEEAMTVSALAATLPRIMQTRSIAATASASSPAMPRSHRMRSGMGDMLRLSRAASVS